MNAEEWDRLPTDWKRYGCGCPMTRPEKLRTFARLHRQRCPDCGRAAKKILDPFARANQRLAQFAQDLTRQMR